MFKQSVSVRAVLEIIAGEAVVAVKYFGKAMSLF